MNGAARRQVPVALLVESSRAYGRGLLRGIAAYAQTHSLGPLYLSERALRDSAPQWIRDCNARGIIARLESEQLIRQIQKMNVPTVDLRGLRALKGIPLIQPDQRAVALLAADHLIERGFVNYACCCFAGINYAEQRITQFSDYVCGCGFSCAALHYARRPHTSSTAAIEEHGLVTQAFLLPSDHELGRCVGRTEVGAAGSGRRIRRPVREVLRSTPSRAPTPGQGTR